MTADGGWLDVDAGFADLAAVMQALREGLRTRGVRVAENTEPRAIARMGGRWIVATDNGPVESDVLVVTAGTVPADRRYQGNRFLARVISVS
jgi:glycine/D-amino acid oxidase-like deaminating enzyme